MTNACFVQLSLEFRVWDLELLWCLELGIWSFFPPCPSTHLPLPKNGGPEHRPGRTRLSKPCPAALAMVRCRPLCIAPTRHRSLVLPCCHTAQTPQRLRSHHRSVTPDVVCAKLRRPRPNPLRRCLCRRPRLRHCPQTHCRIPLQRCSSHHLQPIDRRKRQSLKAHRTRTPRQTRHPHHQRRRRPRPSRFPRQPRYPF